MRFPISITNKVNHHHITKYHCKCRLKHIIRNSLFTEVPVPNQKSERSCICVLVISNLPLFLRCFDWILELFRQCGIFCSRKLY